MTSDPNYRTDFASYINEVFSLEDDTLRWIQTEANRNGLPQISLRADEGRLLQLFIKMIGARKALEIGTLAGYSGTWIARALPSDGKLFTLEKSSKHAEVARASFVHAGVSDKVTILEGEGMTLLKKVEKEAPFDLIFLDADRSSYPTYFRWAAEALRSGGILVAHNAFANGRILAPQSEDDHAMHAFQKAVAEDKRFDSTIVGAGDGMVVALKTG